MRRAFGLLDLSEPISRAFLSIPNVIVRQRELIKLKNPSPSEAIILETNAHARVHDTFWLKSHPYPKMLKSIACADCPWITFARPNDLSENGSPRGSLAKKFPLPWMT